MKFQGSKVRSKEYCKMNFPYRWKIHDFSSIIYVEFLLVLLISPDVIYEWLLEQKLFLLLKWLENS